MLLQTGKITLEEMAVAIVAEGAHIASTGILRVGQIQAETGAVEAEVKASLVDRFSCYGMVEVDRISDADSHVMDIGSEIAVKFVHHAHRHLALRETQGVGVEPVVVGKTGFPSFSGALYVVSVVGIEDTVAPIIDFNAKPYEFRIYHSGVLHVEFPFPEKSGPVVVVAPG